MRVRRKVDFLKMYGTKTHFSAVMGPPKSALKRLQGAFWLSNALIKRDVVFWSEKGEKKSRGCSFAHAAEPWLGPIENIKNHKSGSQISKRGTGKIYPR